MDGHTQPGGAQPAAAAQSQEEAKRMLASQFGIEAAFVRVPALAKLLGIAAPTIYASMRRGTFFLPHWMLNSAPAVRLDDLASWYCLAGRGADRAPRGAAPPPAPGAPEMDAIDRARQRAEDGIARLRQRCEPPIAAPPPLPPRRRSPTPRR